jgi:hypothetical protein
MVLGARVILNGRPVRYREAFAGWCHKQRQRNQCQYAVRAEAKSWPKRDIISPDCVMCRTHLTRIGRLFRASFHDGEGPPRTSEKPLSSSGRVMAIQGVSDRIALPQRERTRLARSRAPRDDGRQRARTAPRASTSRRRNAAGVRPALRVKFRIRRRESPKPTA